VLIVVWFAILFSGRYPRPLFDCVEGVLRWGIRVTGCALILVTDQYPPFRLATFGSPSRLVVDLANGPVTCAASWPP